LALISVNLLEQRQIDFAVLLELRTDTIAYLHRFHAAATMFVVRYTPGAPSMRRAR